MSIGLASDFVVYPDQFWGGVVETLQQYTDAFNIASQNTLRLVTRGIKGEYEKESFMKSTANLISRRDTTSVASVTDLAMSQGELIGVKVNRKIGPVAQTLDAWKKIAVDPAEFSVILGQQTGKSIAVDYINVALSVAKAAITNQSALVYDAYALDTTKTCNHTALISGLAKFGDASARVQAWVMHSKNYFDLMKQALADKIFEVAGVTIYQGTVATFNRPTIVVDSPSLFVSSGTATTTYHVLGLVEDAVEIAESEQRDIISQPVTGLENLVMRIQGEYAFNVRVKGCAWDTQNGGANPTDAAMATGSNWDKVVADDKLMPGVAIKFQ
jgi:hypothetical protein